MPGCSLAQVGTGNPLTQVELQSGPIIEGDNFRS